MFIEFKPGQKYADKDAEISDSMNGFTDCGRILEPGEVVVDIDHLDKSTLETLIETFDIRTQTVWTDRGCHLYYRVESKGALKSLRDGCCSLGFPVEIKHVGNCKAITVKRDGVERVVDNEGKRELLPDFIQPSSKYDNLLGLDDGEGRNDKLFKLNTKLMKKPNRKRILSFVNEFIFEKPLSTQEFETVSREVEFDNKTPYSDTADFILETYKPVHYMEKTYYYDNGKYISNDRGLKSLVYEALNNSTTTGYVREVVGQVEDRCTTIDPNGKFDLKLSNGIIRDGEFIGVDTVDFTPYTIDISYNPKAEPVPEVDEYFSHLTDDNEDYKKLLFEIMGHTLITDPHKNRQLRKFHIIYGQGGEGKSVFLDLIENLLGDRNVSSLSTKQLGQERFVCTLKNKLCNSGDDIEDEPIKSETMKMLKNISTSNRIELRELYKGSESVVLVSTLLFTSNHLLKSWEKGKAYKDRVQWLPIESGQLVRPSKWFEAIFSQKAREYILKLAIEGLERLYKNNKFTSVGIVEKFNSDYHEQNDSTESWLVHLEDTNIDKVDDMRLIFQDRPVKEVYDDYCIWAEDNGLDVLSKSKLKNTICNKYGLIDRQKKVGMINKVRYTLK